ncbi:MAG: hypothetical protein O3A93_04000 [Chloroflexi bacterium]|nr:hypothetical protein [Chloroflexota bacterium]MDA1270409.1 hypothetical protein [Chloroflexota bacterium]PKB58918.1 MAG: hypothetical protein BZY83_04455 [SAR202 cluster bacterium Casp-Chloro-G2]
MRARQRNRGPDKTPQESRQEPPEVLSERRQRKIGVGIGASLIFVVIAVVAFGYYQEFYKPPRVWAGSVRNVEFTMGDLVQRIRVLQGVNRYQGGQVDLSIVPFEYLQNLIHAEILRQQAPALGIQITKEAIERELRRQFLPEATPGQETDPGQLEREFRDSFGSYLTATGLSESEFRVILEEQLTLRALAGLLSQDIEDPQQQVEIQWIQLPPDSNVFIDDVATRLENEDFTRVAQELNAQSQYAGPNGYVGWVPKGAFPELDDAIFGNPEKNIEPLAPGEVSEPIITNKASFLVKVLSLPEERALEDRMGLKLTIEAVEAWKRNALTTGSSQGTVKMNFNSRLYEWVADQVAVTAPRIERPTPVPPLVPGLGGQRP